MPSPASSSFVARSTKAVRFLQGTTAQPMAGFNKPFVAAAVQAGRKAAKHATDASRSVFTSKLSGRPIAPPRKGRPTTGGQFAQFINWDFDSGKDMVEFDLNYLSTAAPYWAIQEIGTNRSARIIASPSGPGAVSVRSQRGRRISSNLAWANGPGSQASPAKRGGKEQLFLRSQLLANQMSSRRMRINREIKAKHYLRDGAKSAFNIYRKDMTKAFRQAYK